MPLDDGWGASAATSGRARRVWWPVALAGAAAAVVAAVLLLRPQPKPEPIRLVQADSLSIKLDTDSTSIQTGTPDAGQTGPIAIPGTLSVTPGTLSVTPGSTRSLLAENEIPDQVGDDAKRDEDDGIRSEATEGVRGILPPMDEILRQAQDDIVRDDRRVASEDDNLEKIDGKKAVSDSTKQYRDNTAVTPLSEIALADLGEIPGQARNDGMRGWDDGTESRRTRRSRAGRVALRVQAGFAGTSLSNGIGSINTLKAVTIPGEWIPASDYKTYTHSSAHTVYGDDVINSGSGNWHEEVQWYYRPEQDVMTPMTVAVRKAPVFPISFGVSAALPLSRSWVLTAGLDYMQRDGYRVYDYNPQSLTLHYLGIPVDIHYYFNPESRWRFYLGAGVHAGKCIAATGGEPLQDPVLFSGNVMVGTDIRLFPGIRLYLAPALSGFFNQSAYLNTWDSKAYFQLRAGLSFDLK